VLARTEAAARDGANDYLDAAIKEAMRLRPVAPMTCRPAALTEARYRLSDGASFMARWGMLLANTSIDNASPAYDYPTWMLDMDSFREFAPGSQQGADIFEDVRALALRAYQFFRWAVTEDFLVAFGGEL